MTRSVPGVTLRSTEHSMDGHLSPISSSPLLLEDVQSMALRLGAPSPPDGLRVIMRNHGLPPVRGDLSKTQMSVVLAWSNETGWLFRPQVDPYVRSTARCLEALPVMTPDSLVLAYPFFFERRPGGAAWLARAVSDPASVVLSLEVMGS